MCSQCFTLFLGFLLTEELFSVQKTWVNAPKSYQVGLKFLKFLCKLHDLKDRQKVSIGYKVVLKIKKYFVYHDMDIISDVEYATKSFNFINIVYLHARLGSNRKRECTPPPTLLICHHNDAFRVSQILSREVPAYATFDCNLNTIHSIMIKLYF